MRLSNGRRPLLHGGFVSLLVWLLILDALPYSLLIEPLSIHLNHGQVLVVGGRSDRVPIPAVLVRRRGETIPDRLCFDGRFVRLIILGFVSR